jgi:hypothetical protein
MYYNIIAEYKFFCSDLDFFRINHEFNFQMHLFMDKHCQC